MPVFRAIMLITLYMLLATASAEEKSVMAPSVDSLLAGNRFLIITPDTDSGDRLGKIFQELYSAEVIIKSADEYTSFIDEAAFDAFVYYGSDYWQLPGQNFIDDMERTGKPVLWINYHGWMLSEKYLGSKGITIQSQHDTSYVEIEMQEVFGLTPTDTTLMSSRPEQVIYWLLSPSTEKIPGAVHSDNLTFVGYSPNLDIFAADFSPFLTAIRSVFGNTPAPANRIFPDYQERVLAGRKDVFRTGVHLPVYIAASKGSRLGYEDDKWHENLVRIKQSGAEWVNFVRTFRQTDVLSSDVQADESLTPGLEGLENIIHDSHELGLMVQVHLAINLENRGPDDWHGMITPDNRDQWWAAYQALVLEMAEFSQRNEVEALIIGTEYSRLQSDEENWRALIRRVREDAQYSGMLGYGANFNNFDIAWVDALDFLGISAYWPLSEDKSPDLKALNQSWDKISEQLDTWMAGHPSLRVEFSEVGYTSQPYSAALPYSWKPHKGGQQSLTEQLQTYRALYQFLGHEPEIKGVHFFASTVEDNVQGSIDYTPFGKPAEKVLKQIMQIR